MNIFRRLLWVDCTAAALAGVAVLAFSGWLSGLHGLPEGLLIFIGGVNLVYASYSFSLARQAERPMRLIKLLVYANVGWALACLGIAAVVLERATVFGVGHLVGEALFVGGLAALEWSQRQELVTAA